MSQPALVLFKRISLSLLVLLTLTGCRLVSSLTYVVPPPVETPTSTPTPEYCAWTWAYGDGSTEFDKAVSEKLAEKGISALVKSSGFGEVNSCTNTFSAMALDVKVEIKVDNLADQSSFATISEEIFSLVKDNLAVSQINNLGNCNISFITPDGSTCYWDQTQRICAE